MKLRFGIVTGSLALAALVGCAGQKGATKEEGTQTAGNEKPAKSSGSSSKAEKAPKGEEGGAEVAQKMPEVNQHAQLLFGDAVKAYDACRAKNNCDWGSLEKKFEAASDADANFAEPEYDLGVICERKGDLDCAEKHYRRAISKRASLVQASENLAVLLQNRGKQDEAERMYQEIITKYPDNGSARARLAEIALRNNNDDQAIQLAKEALFREPKTLTAYKVMMKAYLNQKQYSLSKLVALRALKLDENDPEIYYTLGQISLAEKDVPKARLQFKTAVEKRADFLPAHLQLAKMAMETSDYAGAEQSIRRILAADSKNAEAHLNLGIAYKGMGQYDKAMAEYDTALNLKNELIAAILYKGLILNIKGEPEKAIEMCKAYNASPGADALKGEQCQEDGKKIIAQREKDKHDTKLAECMEKAAGLQQKTQDKYDKAFAALTKTHDGCLQKAGKNKKDQKSCDDAGEAEDKRLKGFYEQEQNYAQDWAKVCAGDMQKEDLQKYTIKPEDPIPPPGQEPKPGASSASADKAVANKSNSPPPSKEDDPLAPENAEPKKDPGTKVASPTPKKDEPAKAPAPPPPPAKKEAVPVKDTKPAPKGDEPDDASL